MVSIELTLALWLFYKGICFKNENIIATTSFNTFCKVTDQTTNENSSYSNIVDILRDSKQAIIVISFGYLN